MTRKDYILIAESIKTVRKDLPYCEAIDTINELIDVLCQKLMLDNPRFNSETFKKACLKA